MKKIAVIFALVLCIATVPCFAQDQKEKKEKEIIPAFVIDFGSLDNNGKEITPPDLKYEYLKKLLAQSTETNKVTGEAALNFDAIFSSMGSLATSNEFDEVYKIWAMETVLSLLPLAKVEEKKDPPFSHALLKMFFYGPEGMKMPIWYYAKENNICLFFVSVVSRGETIDVFDVYRNMAAEEILIRESCNDYFYSVLSHAPSASLREAAAEIILKRGAARNDYDYDLTYVIIHSPNDEQKSKAWNILVNYPCAIPRCAYRFSSIARDGDGSYAEMSKNFLEKLGVRANKDDLKKLSLYELEDLMKVVRGR